MRTPVLVLGFVIGAYMVVTGQGADPVLQKQLKQLFPNAASFTPKGGDPPHFKALGPDQKVLGVAWWTTELEPLERGYDGPIKMLVGIDMAGMLTGVVVAKHNEPYGNFSVDVPAFPAQFKNKSVKDPFKPGDDIDEVSRATITIHSAARSIRKSARRVAKALLTPPGST